MNGKLMTNVIGAPTLDDALAALAKRVGEREALGEKNLIFCEDRLTLLAERAVLEASGGTFLTEVTTFARFLSDGRRVLSKQGSVMEISALIEEYRDELGCFSGSSAQAAYETIAQLSASRVSAERLREGAAETEGLLRLKLSDLAFLLEKYNAFLAERELVDENGYLALLPQKIAETLTDTNVFFFVFPSFTAQAREGVRAAIESAKSVTGIFIAGREELYTNEGARIFRRVAEEYGEARSSMVKCSLEGDALLLRNSLFSPEKFSSAATPSKSVRIFGAEDEAEEMETVAALVRKYAAEGTRYRDIAVLVPGKESFSTVEKVFASYKIPFFADKKRKFSTHPFCAFVLSLCAAAASGGLPEDIDDVASNVCFGDGDEYRNYLMKYGGYRGAVKREIKEGEAVKGYDRASLVSCRERMLAFLALIPRKATGAEYAAGILKLLETANWEETVKTLDVCTAEEKCFLDVSPLQAILNEIAAVLGGRTFTARDFAVLLKNGTDALEISMIPQSADAVYVGDATESRIARVEVMFATGMTDALPRVSADTAVITDGEIKRLGALDVEIEPAIAQVNARARENLALNLCAFRRALYLSCPAKQNGAETVRGEALQYAEKIFFPAPMPALFPYNCCEREPAALRLLEWKDDFERGREDDENAYRSLLAALRASGEGERLSALLAGEEKASVPEAEQLYFAGGSVSPTLLEQYFACPYAGFASRGLKLREREERTVLDTDAGTFVHAVLEQVADRLNSLSSEEECRKVAAEIGNDLLKSARFAPLADTRAGEYTGERLVKEGEEVSAAAYRQLALSSFRVRETEEAISIPALSLAGKADRVDEAEGYVRVIDYKTGRIDDSAVAYYTGRKLQLQLYLLAAANGGKAAGAFYFPAAENYTKQGEAKYRMSGFYSGEEKVVSLMDGTLQEGEKSALFEGGLTGKFTDKGMPQEDFEAFLDYASLVSAGAEEEMRAGNISPSPYAGACAYCKLKSLCGFVGKERREKSVSCGDVVRLVKKERGE